MKQWKISGTVSEAAKKNVQIYRAKQQLRGKTLTQIEAIDEMLKNFKVK